MCTVPNMAVSWSSLTSCFPGMLLTYFLNDFEIVPVAPIITGITLLLLLLLLLLLSTTAFNLGLGFPQDRSSLRSVRYSSSPPFYTYIPQVPLHTIRPP